MTGKIICKSGPENTHALALTSTRKHIQDFELWTHETYFIKDLVKL